MWYHFFFSEATMRFFLLMVSVIFFATFQLAEGDNNEVDNPHGWSEDQELADLEITTNDVDLEDGGAKYRWLAPILYDELEKRGKKKNQKSQQANINQPAGPEEEEEIEKKPKKNKEGGEGKDKKKNKKNKNKNKNKKQKNKKYTEEGISLF